MARRDQGEAGPATPQPSARCRDDIREDIRLRGANINAETLLATDYLNHFNEIVMMIELASDLPESFEMTGYWEPLGYEEHFTRSHLGDRELAIEAYQECPRDIRDVFENTVHDLDDYLVTGLEKAREALEAARHGEFNVTCRELAHEVRSYIDHLSAIIHGRGEGFSSSRAALDTETLEEAQHTIDCLFGT